MSLLSDVLIRCLSNCFQCLRIFYIIFHPLYFISVFLEIFKKTNSIFCLKLFIYLFIFHMLDQMLDYNMTTLTQYFFFQKKFSTFSPLELYSWFVCFFLRKKSCNLLFLFFFLNIVLLSFINFLDKFSVFLIIWQKIFGLRKFV